MSFWSFWAGLSMWNKVGITFVAAVAIITVVLILF